jgi:hypothetical protein
MKDSPFVQRINEAMQAADACVAEMRRLWPHLTNAEAAEQAVHTIWAMRREAVTRKAGA